MDMLYELRLKAESAFLGHQRSPDRVWRFHRFERNGVSHIKLDADLWLKTLKEAADALGYKNLDLAAIRLDEGFRSPAVHFYNRTFDGGKKEQMFEAIKRGAEIVFDVFIIDRGSEELRDNEAPPSSEQLVKMLELAGRMIGLSPWGSKFGFGRFIVMNLNLKTPG